jgi:hypothetical protein
LIPAYNDLNTGIGHAANDQLSLIAGGVEGIRIINNQSIIQTELSSSGNIYFDNNIIQQQFDTHLGSETYLSGFAGHGWQIDNISSSTMATFDDLTVRGTMNIYELLIHQIRATNGSI